MSKHDFEIPNGAKPGEIWFFVNLSMLTSHTPEQVISLTTAMGFVPELRYMTRLVEGERRFDVALLLHQSQVNPSTMPDDFEAAAGEKLLNDWEQLAITLQPDLAVTLRVGRIPTAIAA